MAYNKKQTNTSDVIFVNYDLDKSEKAAFKKMLKETPDKFMDQLEKLIDSGYSVTLKRDNFNECMGCFVRHVENAKNTDMILTGRGGTAFAAMAGALFRHYMLFDEEWGEHKSRRGDVDDD